MPLRVISYDGASYKQQLIGNKNAKKAQKQKYPVITIVLYFGTDKKWTANKKLCDCFDIPNELKPFFNDYKINVFEIAWLPDETIEKFSSDFKILAKYFQTKRLREDYEGSKEEIKHVDSLLKMMSALTGDNSFEVAYNESNLSTEGGLTMCDVVERIVNKGIAQGISKGRAEEKKELILKLIDAKAGSIEQIAAWLKLPVAEVQEIATENTANHLHNA
ncbi:MAG: Rpn family recombination-promoting nuclease/putative transposase [Treponema sp.]|nr:Rpn family recombination-promoting nuclease/putative transposase [Treponema sp.]MBR4631117.1 Rpn family recombination-promoting nuclease/putative transposase [Treponema sp.]MBR6913987.1 Rpn family recombination-promoting nuclease/putative transposase [Treponema sp.]